MARWWYCFLPLFSPFAELASKKTQFSNKLAQLSPMHTAPFVTIRGRVMLTCDNYFLLKRSTHDATPIAAWLADQDH